MRANLYDTGGIKLAQVEVGWPAPWHLEWQGRHFRWSMLRRGYYEFTPTPVEDAMTTQHEDDRPVARGTPWPTGSHECPFPYPAPEHFTAAVGTVLAKLRGEDVDLGCLVHCSWVVAGYAASHVPHDHPDAMHAAALSREELAAALQSAAAAVKEGGGGERVAMQSIPWQPIAILVLQLALEWLQRRQ